MRRAQLVWCARHSPAMPPWGTDNTTSQLHERSLLETMGWLSQGVACLCLRTFRDFRQRQTALCNRYSWRSSAQTQMTVNSWLRIEPTTCEAMRKMGTSSHKMGHKDSLVKCNFSCFVRVGRIFFLMCGVSMRTWTACLHRFYFSELLPRLEKLYQWRQLQITNKYKDMPLLKVRERAFHAAYIHT